MDRYFNCWGERNNNRAVSSTRCCRAGEKYIIQSSRHNGDNGEYEVGATDLYPAIFYFGNTKTVYAMFLWAFDTIFHLVLIEFRWETSTLSLTRLLILISGMSRLSSRIELGLQEILTPCFTNDKCCRCQQSKV